MPIDEDPVLDLETVWLLGTDSDTVIDLFNQVCWAFVIPVLVVKIANYSIKNTTKQKSIKYI